MTFKIRKLYNVLVVGGMAAAGLAGCEKKAETKADPKATTTTADPAPATPDPVKAEPVKAEPVKAEPVEPAKADPAVKVAEPDPTPAKADPKTVVKKTVPAKKAEGSGSGAKGWS